MKFSYKFSNLLGTIYRKGNVIFTNDGNSLVSPVGNRITIYDLKNNKSKTLSLDSRYNYTAIGISPNGCLMVAVNEKGEAQMISMISQTVIYTHKFAETVNQVRFSPDGRYVAIARAHIVSVYIVPGEITGDYGNFKAYRHFHGANDDVTWIDWSSDSRLLAIGAKDNTTKLCALEFLENFRPYQLASHTDSIVGCFFEESSLDVNTISRNGQLCIWECSLRLSDLTPKRFGAVKEEDDEQSEDEIDTKKSLEEPDNGLRDGETMDEMERIALTGRDDQGKIVAEDSIKAHPFSYTRLARHYLLDEVRKSDKHAHLSAANYHQRTKLLITAYSNGAFFLHEMPDVNLIHSLSITEFPIQTAAFNCTGDWIALGSSNLGQLLVWEWQSEQYIMKQQGHSCEMNCITYSPDGQYIVTGGEDAKIKVWNVNSGFCFVTFSEHSSAVTALEFSQTNKFVVSASLDGTVRAYDLIRYRNFRTFTSPRPVQFSSLAIDASGELVVAGGRDIFEIYLWSMKFGRLLEVLSGHEGPVVSLAFAPVATSSMLVSGSWDHTIRIWNCLETSGQHETVEIQSNVTAVAFKPDGEEVAVAALSGNIQIFSVKNAMQLASIEGRNDLGAGMSEADLTSANKNKESKYFSTIAYSADGETLLAAGKSKNVCIYRIAGGILLKKIEITQNHSLDGLDDFINRRNLTEFGNMALVEQRDPLEGGNVSIRLPGVQKGDMAARNFKPEVNVFCVRFSPTAQSWAAATTEGLLIYSLDRGIVFDPLNLSLEVTPKAARECLQQQHRQYATALLMALKLNEVNLIQEIIEQIPYNEVDLVVYTLPEMYVERLLEFVSKQISTSHHIEFYLSWATKLLTTHASKENVLKQQSLISIQDSLQRKYDSLSKVCDFNKYTLKVLQEVVATNAAADQTSDADDDDDDDDSDNDDRHDLDDGNLMLINSNSNGAHDHDVEMQTDSDSDSDESMDAMSADDT